MSGFISNTYMRFVTEAFPTEAVLFTSGSVMVSQAGRRGVTRAAEPGDSGLFKIWMNISNLKEIFQVFKMNILNILIYEYLHRIL